MYLVQRYEKLHGLTRTGVDWRVSPSSSARRPIRFMTCLMILYPDQPVFVGGVWVAVFLSCLSLFIAIPQAKYSMNV